MKRFLCLIYLATFASVPAKSVNTEPLWLTVPSKDHPHPVWLTVPSTDQLFEAYLTPEGVDKDVNGDPYFYGAKVYVRMHGSNEEGFLLLENSRNTHFEWSPNTHLLGIEDHWDGHSSVVYVYEVSLETKSRHIQYKLVFHSPDNAYDRKWFIEGWNPKRRLIRLRLEQMNHNDVDWEKNWAPGLVIKHCSFVIGTRALSEKE